MLTYYEYHTLISYGVCEWKLALESFGLFDRRKTALWHDCNKNLQKYALNFATTFGLCVVA
jgi:hypothetical protein